MLSPLFDFPVAPIRGSRIRSPVSPSFDAAAAPLSHWLIHAYTGLHLGHYGFVVFPLLIHYFLSLRLLF